MNQLETSIFMKANLKYLICHIKYMCWLKAHAHVRWGCEEGCQVVTDEGAEAMSAL